MHSLCRVLLWLLCSGMFLCSSAADYYRYSFDRSVELVRSPNLPFSQLERKEKSVVIKNDWGFFVNFDFSNRLEPGRKYRMTIKGEGKGVFILRLGGGRGIVKKYELKLNGEFSDEFTVPPSTSASGRWEFRRIPKEPASLELESLEFQALPDPEGYIRLDYKKLKSSRPRPAHVRGVRWQGPLSGKDLALCRERNIGLYRLSFSTPEELKERLPLLETLLREKLPVAVEYAPRNRDFDKEELCAVWKESAGILKPHAGRIYALGIAVGENVRRDWRELAGEMIPVLRGYFPEQWLLYQPGSPADLKNFSSHLTDYRTIYAVPVVGEDDIRIASEYFNVNPAPFIAEVVPETVMRIEDDGFSWTFAADTRNLAEQLARFERPLHRNGNREQQMTSLFNAYRKQKTPGSFNLIFATDSHYLSHPGGKPGYGSDSAEHMKEMATIARTLKLDLIAHGGDIISGREKAHDPTYEDLKLITSNILASGIRPAIVIGNHDNNVAYKKGEGTLTDREWHDLCTKPALEAGAVGDSKHPSANYFYYDFPEVKLRVIALATLENPMKRYPDGKIIFSINTWDLSAHQLQWLGEQALNFTGKADAGEWGVLFLTHLPPDPSFPHYAMFEGVKRAFLEGGSYSGESPAGLYPGKVSCDFSKQGKGRILAMLAGHVHSDIQEYPDGFLVAKFRCDLGSVQDIGKPDSASLALISIDPGRNELRVLRYGRGPDLTLPLRKKIIPGDNLLFNGSFEMGTDGFAMEKYLRPDRNPDLKYLPLKTAEEAAPEGGKQCLTVENPYGESWRISSKEFFLKAETEYILSGWARSADSKARTAACLKTVNEKDWFEIGKTVLPAAPEWRFFRQVIRTGKEARWYHLAITSSDLLENTLQLDDLALRETGSRAAVALEAVAVPERHFYTQDDGSKEANGVLKVWNRSDSPQEADLRLSAADDFTGETIFDQNFRVSLKGGEAKEIPFAIPLKRYGGFRLKVSSGTPVYAHDGFFVSMGKYTAKPVNLKKDFVVAINDGFRYEGKPRRPVKAYTAYNAPMERRFDIYEKAGIRLMRDHDGGIEITSWQELEPEPGKFDFAHFDRCLSILKKRNIELYPVLGRHHFVMNLKAPNNCGRGWPDWLLPQMTHIEKDPETIMNRYRGWIYLPPAEQWRRYVALAARRLKGRVQAYEVVNEPNLYLSPEHYLELLRPAYEEIRKEDPAALVTAFSVSSDFWTKVDVWLKKSLELGSLRYADVFTFHPYGSRELASREPAGRNIRKFAEEMKQYGRPGIPLWNSELYYLFDRPRELVQHANYFRPHHFVWRFLTDLGEGCGQSTAIHGSSLWKCLLTPHMLMGSAFHEAVPGENMVVLNALARLFEGATPIAGHRYPFGGVGYVYRKDGEAIAAIWNFEHRTNARISGLEGMDVLDLYGNPIAPPRDFTDVPVYLKPGRLSEKQFLDAVQKLRIELALPVAVSPAARLLKENELRFSIRNEAPEAVKVRLESASPEEAFKPFEVSLAGSEERNLQIPGVKIPAETDSLKLRIADRHEERLESLAIYRNTVCRMGEEYSFRSPDGVLRGNVRFQLDGENLSYRISVQDATDAGARGKRQMWETDCIELFFDLDPSGIRFTAAERYIRDVTFRVFTMPRDDKRSNYAVWGTNKYSWKNMRRSFRITPEGYVFNGGFTLPAGVREIGFALKADDAESPNATAIRSAVFPGEYAKERPANRMTFGILELKE